jgi:hypothetical protein
VQRRSSRPSLFEIVDMIYVLDPFFYFIFFSLLLALLQAVYHSGQRLGRLYVLEMNSHGSITFHSFVRSEPVGESVDFMFFSRLLSRHVHRSIPLQLEMDKYVNVTCPTCPPSTVKRETVKMRHLESVQISGCRRSYSSGLFVFSKKTKREWAQLAATNQGRVCWVALYSTCWTKLPVELLHTRKHL